MQLKLNNCGMITPLNEYDIYKCLVNGKVFLADETGVKDLKMLSHIRSELCV